MSTVTIPEDEYKQLRQQATAYRNISRKLFAGVLRDSVENVIADFRKTDLYSEDFLYDLESGLRKSSYVRK